MTAYVHDTSALLLDEAAEILSRHLAMQFSTHESWMFLRQARDKLREASALRANRALTAWPADALALIEEQRVEIGRLQDVGVRQNLEWCVEVERLQAVLAGAERALSKFLAHQLSHQESYSVLKAARDNARAVLPAPSVTSGMPRGEKAT
jgi:hypothetical protein